MRTVKLNNPAVTTDLNSSPLHCEFIYNNTPYGVVQLACIHINGILQNQEQTAEGQDVGVLGTSDF